MKEYIQYQNYSKKKKCQRDFKNQDHQLKSKLVHGLTNRKKLKDKMKKKKSF